MTRAEIIDALKEMRGHFLDLHEEASSMSELILATPEAQWSDPALNLTRRTLLRDQVENEMQNYYLMAKRIDQIIDAAEASDD